MVTIVYDNYERGEGLRADWGFGCVIEGYERTILFDTGADGNILLDNMRSLGCHPHKIDVVVLSHSHWDHVGGLEAFLAHNSDVAVYMPGVFSGELKGTVRSCGAKLIETADGREVCRHVSITPVLRGLRDEQALRLEGEEGWTVLTGCAHPGIVRVLESARASDSKQIHSCLGGFHMKEKAESAILRTIEQLRQLGVRRAGPCHCSGDQTRELMRESFGGGSFQAAVGKRIPV